MVKETRAEESPFVRRFLLVAVFASTISMEAQQLRVMSRDFPPPNNPGAQLVFGESGKLLRVIGTRFLTYDAASAVLASNVPLAANAEILSISANGQTVLFGVRGPATSIRLLVFDAGTGQTQALPLGWYDPEYAGSTSAVSADGRLISIYSEGNNLDQPMVVTVYDWPTKQRVAQRASAYISAGGAFGGGVTGDGAVEFVNNRVGRKLVDLKTGRPLGSFAFHSLRSADGAWVIEFPDRTWNESAPRDILIKDGKTAAVRAKLDAQVADEETYGVLTGSFCGTTRRFVLVHRVSVAVYAIPSGRLLAELPTASWRDGGSSPGDQPRVACSASGTRVAILSGDRLTIHDLR